MAKKKTKKAVKKEQPQKPVVVPHPTAGRKVEDFEKQLDQALAGGQGQEKRGRGRPRKEPIPKPETVNVPDVIIQQAVKMPFDLWAVSQDVEQLKLVDSEAKLLAEPAKQLLDYYAPKIPPIAIAWASLGLAAYSIMAVRLKVIAQIKKEKLKSGNPRPSSVAGQSAVHASAPPMKPAAKNQDFPSEIKAERV